MIGMLALFLRNPPTTRMRRFLTEAFGRHLDFFCDSLLAGAFGIGWLVALYGFTDTLTDLHNRQLGHRIVNPTVAVIVVVSCFITLIAPTGDDTLLASLYLGQGLFAALLVASLGASFFMKLCSVRFPLITSVTIPLSVTRSPWCLPECL